MSKLIDEARKNKVNDISDEHFDILLKSPFKLVRNTINEGNFESVRLIYFGTFVVDKYRKKIQDDFKNSSKEANS